MSSGTFHNYYYSKSPTAASEITDEIILASAIICPPRFFVAFTIAAVTYYIANDEPDMAIAYLAGYGLGKVAEELISMGIVKASNAYQYYKLQRELKVAIREFETSIAQSSSRALVEFYEKPISNKCFEWILKADDVPNYWIKAEGSQVMIGKVVTEGEKTTTTYLAHEFNYSKILAESTDEKVLREVVEELTNVAKGGQAGKVFGHTTEWSLMTSAEKRAFQHSYSRHADELGLPNWKESQAEQLRNLFNSRATEIRNAGKNNFFNTQELVNGIPTTVNRTEPIINGQKYFYYETLDEKFISVGKMP